MTIWSDRMGWHSLLVDIRLDLLERPGDQRIDLDQTPLIDLEHLQPLSLGTLTPSPTGDDCPDSELSIRTSSRLDLDEVIVRRFVRLP